MLLNIHAPLGTRVVLVWQVEWLGLPVAPFIMIGTIKGECGLKGKIITQFWKCWATHGHKITQKSSETTYKILTNYSIETVGKGGRVVAKGRWLERWEEIRRAFNNRRRKEFKKFINNGKWWRDQVKQRQKMVLGKLATWKFSEAWASSVEVNLHPGSKTHLCTEAKQVRKMC